MEGSRARVDVGTVPIGGGAPLALIAGPCVIEGEALAFEVADALREITGRLGLPLVFKSSYDKANRTSLSSFRGPGIERGLRILEGVRERFGVPVLSDVHSVEEVAQAGGVLDCLQIPAFLCRQTDLLVAAGRTGKPVNVKKGQFLAPEDMDQAVEKVRAGGSGGVLLTERGSTFGYRYLTVDFQGMARMGALGWPVVFDATHSVQRPGGLCGASGGDRAFAAPLARAAAAVGIDALFVEVHPRPEEALCDGPNSVALSDLEALLRPVLAIDAARREAA
ncbi:MAG: 3-deoxy-8-phosphooctulonate synthase [Deltaproteobacteria bacterium]|nr:3-deoxy-8-phosphooctulonate synthase [Deltaproteobacteria bacterium]